MYKVQNVYFLDQVWVKATLSKLIPEVCNVLWRLIRECIVIPQDQAGWLAKAQEFQEKWQYPVALPWLL